MRPRRMLKLYNLERPRIRQSMNKVNLYNLWRADVPRARSAKQTMFQQKWAARAALRAYHGEHIPEKKWNRLFSRRLAAAVDIPPTYLARYDGSEQSAGRGSGRNTGEVVRAWMAGRAKAVAGHLEAAARARDRDRSRKAGRRDDADGDLAESEAEGVLFGEAAQQTDGLSEGQKIAGELVQRPFSSLPPDMINTTPYMAMTFAPMERRLDIAVFRALFASSARQARQLIKHGRVMVNGKKMMFPAYLLNPGDMFQVDPQAIMLAMGAKKPGKAKAGEGETAAVPLAADVWDVVQRAKKALVGVQSSSSSAATPSEDDSAVPLTASSLAELAAVSERASRVAERRMRARARLPADFVNTSAMDQVVDALAGLDLDRKAVLSTIPAAEAVEEEEQSAVQEEEAAGEKGADEVKAEAAAETDGAAADQTDGSAEIPRSTSAVEWRRIKSVTPDVLSELRALVAEAEKNPYDAAAPYATPWRPRPYMPAFAFVPRYLEVDPLVGAAIYLRHPVARPGKAEVPTPFPLATSQLGFNWYLRRR